MRILLISLFAVLSFGSNAAHINGGEIYYDYLGNNEYKITIELYRDCQGGGAPFDDPMQYTVFYDNGTMYDTLNVALNSSSILPILYDDPCVTVPDDVCVEKGVYIDTVTLPMTPDGYYITFQRCCWSNVIDNIADPGDWGLTITTDIPGSNLVGVENNCARYDNYPALVLCPENTLSFDHAATDPDGDSLAYFLCAPPTVHLDEQQIGFPIYDPELPEPYGLVTWNAGFSAIQPFGVGSNITLDPNTGMMTFTPSATGTFVASVCTEEWRNGVLINSKNRTFGYTVVLCDMETPMTVNVMGLSELIEDCGATTGFIVTREDTTESVDLQVFISGTGTNGIDYNQIPGIITLPIGVTTDTIAIIPFLDGITEGDETVIFNIVVENPCDQTFDTTTAYVTIKDYHEMIMTHTDRINVCDESEVSGQVQCDVSFGVPPYFYSWNPNYSNDSVIVFPTSYLEPNLNLMSVEAFDQCGKSVVSGPIRVYNQCPLRAPNVITSNNDGINEFFIIQNLEDYDKVSLMIFNRWGNLVYENNNYLNEWDGRNMRGVELSEGTYTYIVTPESVKYIYDDAERSKFTAHGFVQIIKD